MAESQTDDSIVISRVSATTLGASEAMTRRPWWTRVLPQGSFARHVAVVAGGTALGQAITVAASPIITRLYTPADFGLLSVFVSSLALAVTVASARYEVAIPLPAEDEDAGNLLALSLAIVATLSVIVGLVGITVGARWLTGTAYSALAPYAWLLALSMVGAGTYQVLSFWAMRKKAFGMLARTKVGQAVGQVTTQMILGVLSAGATGLLIGDVVGRVSGSGTILRLAWKEDRHILHQISLRGMRTLAVRYRRFPLLASGSALLNAATLQAPLLLLAAFYGPQTAGLYALGQRVLAVPMSLVGSAIANVYYSTLSAVARTEPQRLQPLFWRVTRKLAMVGIGPAAVAGVLGPWLCGVVFGEQWSGAGTFLRLCAPMLLMQFIAGPLGGTLDVLERQDLHLIREIVRQSLALGALFAAKALALDAWHAVLLFSVAGTLGSLFYISSTWYALRDASTA